MKRRLFFMLTCLSLMSFIASAALWIRSHWDSDVISRENSAGDVFGLQTHPGGIEWSQHPATFAIWQGTVWTPGKGKWAFSTSHLGDPMASSVFFMSAAVSTSTNSSGGSTGTFTLNASSPPQGVTIGVTPVVPSLGPSAQHAPTRFFSSGSGSLSAAFTFAATTAPSNSFQLTPPVNGTFQLAPPAAKTSSQPQSPEILDMVPGIAAGTSRPRQSFDTGYAVSGVATQRGTLNVGPVRLSPRPVPPPSYLTLTLSRAGWTPPSSYFLGFGYETMATLPGSLSVATGSPYLIAPTVRVAAPFWFLLLLTGILPGLWVGRKVQVRRRVRAGMCVACGYDLRATPGRCPECGNPARTGDEITGG